MEYNGHRWSTKSRSNGWIKSFLDRPILLSYSNRAAVLFLLRRSYRTHLHAGSLDDQGQWLSSQSVRDSSTTVIQPWQFAKRRRRRLPVWSYRPSLRSARLDQRILRYRLITVVSYHKLIEFSLDRTILSLDIHPLWLITNRRYSWIRREWIRMLREPAERRLGEIMTYSLHSTCITDGN